MTVANRKSVNAASADFCDLDFDRIYADVIKKNDWSKLSGLLNDKQFTVKDMGDVTYRLLNYWMSEGLIEDDRAASSKGWRKLSLKDAFWLQIICKLRRFGFPLEKIDAVHKSLFTKDGKYSYRNFELALLLCTATPPLNMFIVVLDDGEAHIATLQSLWYHEAVNGYAAPYIRINLNALVCDVLGDTRYAPERVQPVVLSDDEIDVLGSYRERDFDEFRVHAKHGRLDRIDKSRAVPNAPRIHELLSETRFGEIKLKVENGKVIYTHHTKQEKK